MILEDEDPRMVLISPKKSCQPA